MSPRTELAQNAKLYIDEHYQDKFSLKEIADYLHVNESYLLRTFSKELGTTMLNYHNRVRVGHAADMLKNSKQSISYISDSVGCVSSAHFSRLFKKFYNCTPSEYRKNKSH